MEAASTRCQSSQSENLPEATSQILDPSMHTRSRGEAAVVTETEFFEAAWLYSPVRLITYLFQMFTGDQDKITLVNNTQMCLVIYNVLRCLYGCWFPALAICHMKAMRPCLWSYHHDSSPSLKFSTYTMDLHCRDAPEGRNGPV